MPVAVSKLAVKDKLNVPNLFQHHNQSHMPVCHNYSPYLDWPGLIFHNFEIRPILFQLNLTSLGKIGGLKNKGKRFKEDKNASISQDKVSLEKRDKMNQCEQRYMAYSLAWQRKNLSKILSYKQKLTIPASLEIDLSS